MRLYAGNATGTLQEGENILLQISLPIFQSGGAKILSWSVSFNGLIAGNSISFSLVADSTTGTALETEVATVLDGSYNSEYEDLFYGPYIRSDFTLAPNFDRTLDGPLQVSDPSFTFRQYGTGREPKVRGPGTVSLRCTPDGMLAATGYKANITFLA